MRIATPEPYWNSFEVSFALREADRTRAVTAIDSDYGKPIGTAHPNSLTMETAPARTVSHYRILAKLGAGGMGEVYLAEDTALGRNVALKLLPDALASDEGAARHLIREAQAAAQLDHPNI